MERTFDRVLPSFEGLKLFAQIHIYCHEFGGTAVIFFEGLKRNGWG